MDNCKKVFIVYIKIIVLTIILWWTTVKSYNIILCFENPNYYNIDYSCSFHLIFLFCSQIFNTYTKIVIHLYGYIFLSQVAPATYYIINNSGAFIWF